MRTALLLSPPIFLALVFGATLATRLYGLTDESIWMDEDMQAGQAHRHPLDPRLAVRAAKQQQPPLDYVFEALGLQSFGVTPVGARFHAALGSAVTAVLLVLAAMRITQRPWVWLFAALLSLTHPLLLRYGQEGRPVSTAVLFATLQLLLVLMSLYQPERLRRPVFFALSVLAQIALLWSIGFQPIVFLLASALCLAPLLFSCVYRQTALLWYLSMGSALLIALPVLNGTVQHSTRYLHEPSLLGMAPALFARISAASLDSIPTLYRDAMGDALAPALIILIAGSAAALTGARAARSSPARRSALVYLSLFAASFPALFVVLFEGLISYRITTRYYLVFVPSLLMLLVQLVDTAAAWLSDRHASPSRTVGGLLLITASTAIVALQGERAVTEVYGARSNADWPGLYALFEEPENRGAHAYMMNVNRIERFSPFFYGRRFYYKGDTPVALHQADRLPDHYRDEDIWTQAPRLFLCARYGFERLEKSLLPQHGAAFIHRLRQLRAVRIEPRPNMKRAVLATFRRMVRRLSTSDHHFRPMVILFELEKQEREPARMAAIIQRLEKMNRRGKLTKVIKRLKADYKKMDTRKRR